MQGWQAVAVLAAYDLLGQLLLATSCCLGCIWCSHVAGFQRAESTVPHMLSPRPGSVDDKPLPGLVDDQSGIKHMTLTPVQSPCRLSVAQVL